MAEKANLRRTIRRVGFAPMLRGASESSTTAMSFDSIIWFEHNEAGGREYTATANGEMSSIYADGYEVYTSDENHGYDIQLQLLSVIDDIDVMWLGNYVDGSGAVSEFANNVERSRIPQTARAAPISGTTASLHRDRMFPAERLTIPALISSSLM